MDCAVQDAHRPRPQNSAQVQVASESPDVCRTWTQGSPALGPKQGVKDHARGKNTSEQHLGAVLAQRRCKSDLEMRVVLGTQL